MRRALITEQPQSELPLALGIEEFSRLMEAFTPFPDTSSFAIAVSGGPDSMALALCMKAWTTKSEVPVRALIVDHQLRPQSSEEAKETQQRLKTLGLTADILRWDHPPLASRLHITARKARYELLSDACRRYGIDHLLFAHQQEDQAETILMRLAKGSGVDGLAGIPRQHKLNGVRILRPLLDIPKERLIATCRQAHLAFVTDPSNQSEKFARGRLRRVLPILANEGLTVERLTDLGNRAAEAKEALTYYTSAFLRVATRRDDADILRIDLEQLRSAPRAIAQRALSICLMNFHGDGYASERASLTPLLNALCADEEMAPRTLHGCLISKQSDAATLMREASAITEAPRLCPGESLIWDGRWHMTLNKNINTDHYVIAALGNPPHEAVDKLAPGLRQRVPQDRARASLPTLWHAGNLALIPAFGSLTTHESLVEASLVRPWPPSLR